MRDLYNFALKKGYVERAKRIAELEAKLNARIQYIEELEAALRVIAKQKLPHEIENNTGDFEQGYECVVLIARNALRKPE